MKEKNSTKKEKIKFFESLVYILLIIVVIIANTYGNIYVKLIPMLFLLGIIGKIVYDRPVITSLFGGTFSIITMYINGTYKFSEILISSFGNFIMIMLGEIIAICLIACARSIEKKAFASDSIKNYIITVLFFILSIYVTFYMNGNIFKYKEAEYRLQNYLKENYKESYFTVEGYRYVPLLDRGYTFKVTNENMNGVYKFIVYEKLESEIYDEFKNNTIKMNNTNISKFIANNINIENLHVNSEYTKYNEAKISVQYKQEKEDYNEDITKKLIELISKLRIYSKFSDIHEIGVVIKDKTNKNINIIYINIEDYIKYEVEKRENQYILNMLQVEFFDI